ncbi:AraC family transcriptional regulator [Chitinimonas lacunae]|uniref:AraC family transcriptional regulator n=1 Tax=Chitinimonas lacunae TaxID=1963018 RepID=A0ABV8MYN8_9NEIS
MVMDLLEVRRFTHPPRSEPEPHSHQQGQLLALQSGVVSITTGNGRWLMPPGCLGWLPPRLPHGAAIHGQMCGVALYFDPSWSQRHLPATLKVVRPTPLLTALLDELSRAADWSAGRLAPYLATFADALVRQPAQPCHLPMPSHPRLLELTTHLLHHPDDDSDLDGWARRAGLSRRTLTRRFLEQTGCSLGQWRQQMRLFLALEHLGAGTPVTTVALSLGYRSVSAFIDTFRRHLGITPGHWQRITGPGGAGTAFASDKPTGWHDEQGNQAGR